MQPPNAAAAGRDLPVAGYLLQYHPETAVVRGTDETSPVYFTAIVNAAENNMNQPYKSKESRL